MAKLSAYDEIIRAKVQLQKEKPFFSFLILHLVPKEASEMLKSLGSAGMGVDARGTLYYDPDFILKMSREELKGVIVHEAMHLVLLHLQRIGRREPSLFNVANDLVINDILVNNKISLPKEGLIPSSHEFDIWGMKIKNLNEKSSEQVYDELYHNLKKQIKQLETSGQMGFDTHIYGDQDGSGDGKDDNKKGGKKGKTKQGIGKKLTEAEAKKLAKKWKTVIAEAASYARQRGQLPVGMERIVDDILGGKVSWRHRLTKYITNELPVDFSYCRPHKKSFSTGFYMPMVTREKLKCVVHTDTSGSIGQDELTDFLGEICTIARSFANIEMDLVICDAAIHDIYRIDNNTIGDIINLKIRGGGGTSHRPVVDWINEEKPMTKIFISLTDGYSDIETTYKDLPGSCKCMIVLPQGGKTDDSLEEYGEVIRIGD